MVISENIRTGAAAVYLSGVYVICFARISKLIMNPVPHNLGLVPYRKIEAIWSVRDLVSIDFGSLTCRDSVLTVVAGRSVNCERRIRNGYTTGGGLHNPP